ncbi:MAG: PQQ-binding-like beta-propeller repeat protein, partial [Planctomycetes bacterium]|nr:PQQ-binding-like beta-propeller repeat protein [Planctomycetota bacterium]
KTASAKTDGDKTGQGKTASDSKDPVEPKVTDTQPPKLVPNTDEGAVKVSGDCPQWCGSPGRNNVRLAHDLPTDWDVGEFDDETGAWKGGGKHIKWVARLGSQSYGNAVVADGRVYVGTNNAGAHLKRFPEDVDLGCLLCFRESDGKFLWQHSSRKLKNGRVQDWPWQGICDAPLVEGDRLWFVSSRGEVVCLDTQGFHDGENDGPFKDEESKDKDEADAIWYFDMVKELGIFQHNMCSCSVTVAGDILFVNTSNGVDYTHVNLPSPNAPTFIAMNKNTGEVLWTDKSPGTRVLHGQWSSPTYGVLGGVPQVIFAGGDGWVYSFHAKEFSDQKAQLLWAFDANPKASKWLLSGRGDRNNIIATPVIYQGNVFVAVGQDPEHGEGVGRVWCIDPTKRGDVSPELVYKVGEKTPIPREKQRRLQAADPEKDFVVRDNENSAAIWYYAGADLNGDGKIYGFNETMHRSCGTVAIKDDILVISDFSGLVHCLDAKTGKRHWIYDMLAEAWGSPLIADGKIFIADSDGDVSIFNLSADPAVAMKKDKRGKDQPIASINMDNGVKSTPIVAHNVLYIASMSHLFAIQKDAKPAQ